MAHTRRTAGRDGAMGDGDGDGEEEEMFFWHVRPEKVVEERWGSVAVER